MFENWVGKILINGKQADPGIDLSGMSGKVDITLLPYGYVEQDQSNTNQTEYSDDKEYVITVKSYMTQPSTDDFAFMRNFNKDVPMPLMTMVGTKEKESPKMFYMKLHGDIIAETVDTCMCCGRPLENPVSRYFGMGPICGKHNYVNPFDSQEELKKAVADYKKQLRQITWEGWIPKSAILEERVRNAK